MAYANFREEKEFVLQKDLLENQDPGLVSLAENAPIELGGSVSNETSLIKYISIPD